MCPCSKYDYVWMAEFITMELYRIHYDCITVRRNVATLVPAGKARLHCISKEGLDRTLEGENCFNMYDFSTLPLGHLHM